MRCWIVWLWSLCVAVPLSFDWALGSLLWVLTDRAFVIPRVVEGTAMQSLITATPYVAWATWATMTRADAATGNARAYFVAGSIAGLLATTALHAWTFVVVYDYWTQRRTTGVDLGLACTMCASPLLVGAAMLAGGTAFRALQRRRDRSAGGDDAGGDQEQREHDPAQP